MNGKQPSLDSFLVGPKIPLQARMRAAAGIPAYIRRKRRIEDLEDDTRADLIRVFEQALVDNGGDEALARNAMHEYAQSMDLSVINDLIERHNRYYPIEANLATDVKTSKMLVAGKPWKPLAPVTWRDFCDL